MAKAGQGCEANELLARMNGALFALREMPWTHRTVPRRIPDPLHRRLFLIELAKFRKAGEGSGPDAEFEWWLCGYWRARGKPLASIERLRPAYAEDPMFDYPISIFTVTPAQAAAMRRSMVAE